ncbi:hypothetical protein INT45_007902 [Circinella minor]|uniref:Uncharacterized protein n=1 Tax=Circinella minor TaxID=1195481 RepID=A0A8H7S8C5_9FUNG|nr:hypothetical protein INT45_007902 [Circinella minor]
MSHKKRPRTQLNQKHQHANKSSPDNRPKTITPIIKSIRRSIFTPGSHQQPTQGSYIRTTDYFRSINPSLFFETTSITNNRSIILSAIAKQFPDTPPLGVQLRFKDKRVVVEITPCDDLQRNTLSTKGFILEGQSIIGTPALRKGSGFLIVNVYDLPHLPEHELVLTIQQMFQPYGRILDISLFLSAPHLFFIGQGCVTLDVTDSDQTLATHTLHFPGIDHDIRAFWKGSPPYCRICHEDTHEKAACPKAKAGHYKACSACGGYGRFHSVSCFQQHKQTSPYPQQTGITTSTVAPSVNTAKLNIQGPLLDSTPPPPPPSPSPSPSPDIDDDINQESEAEYSSPSSSPHVLPHIMEIDVAESPSELDGNISNTAAIPSGLNLDGYTIPPTIDNNISITLYETTALTNNSSTTSEVTLPSENIATLSPSNFIGTDSTTAPSQITENNSSMSILQTVNVTAARLLGSTYNESGIRRSSRPSKPNPKYQ